VTERKRERESVGMSANTPKGRENEREIERHVRVERREDDTSTSIQAVSQRWTTELDLGAAAWTGSVSKTLVQQQAAEQQSSAALRMEPLPKPRAERQRLHDDEAIPPDVGTTLL